MDKSTGWQELSFNLQMLDMHFPVMMNRDYAQRFSIEITHNANYTAVSNMPVLRIGVDSESPYVTTVFEETPYMQTYIVAFLISNFDSIGNNNATPQRVYAKSESIALGDADFALDIGERTLVQIEKDLNMMTFSLPKLDQIAIPDFQWAAMEKWGVCFYREEFLLYNDAMINMRQRDFTVMLIAHEYVIR